MGGQAFRKLSVGRKLGKSASHRANAWRRSAHRRTHSGAGRKQFLLFGFQGPRQKNQLPVGDTADLRLNFGNRVFADVPANSCATCGEHGLRPAFAVADFSYDRANNILRNGLAHNFALTLCEGALPFIPISEGTQLKKSSLAVIQPRNFHQDQQTTAGALAPLQTEGLAK